MSQNVSRDTSLLIPLDSIRMNPHQPRKNFDDGKIQELSESIKKHGLQQPITVTPADDTGIYTLIAGERRVRAARQAGLSEISGIIRLGDIAVLAMVENLQRVDITPLEEAQGFQDLLDRDETYDSVSALVGKSRSYISQKIRLLKLPEVIKIAMESDYYGKGKLSEGAARQLMRLRMIDKVATKKCIVRENHMAEFSDSIINSPHRLRSVSAIQDMVDWVLYLLYLGDGLKPLDKEAQENWCADCLKKIESGERLDIEDQIRAVYHLVRPDFSKLTDSDWNNIHDALERVADDGKCSDPGEGIIVTEEVPG